MDSTNINAWCLGWRLSILYVYVFLWNLPWIYKCKQMHYLLSLLRRLRAIFPQNLLVQVYKSYIQPKLDYGLTTQENLTHVQRLQNHAARLILGNFDYINFRGIELVKSLGLYTIEERRDYFLATLMFKSVHGLAPAYLCNQVVMNFDVNGYDTRGTDSMNVYLPKFKERYLQE